MIETGKKSQIKWSQGNWIFLDIGFAQGKNHSCGFLVGDGNPEKIQFSETRNKVIDISKSYKAPLNFVIEAPLSVCFDSAGNPTGRLIEKKEKDSGPRYWYMQGGCVVMVAAMYLIRDLYKVRRSLHIRLFEGFVSYKRKKKRSDHLKDVLLLRQAVQNPKRFAKSFYSPGCLKNNSDDKLISAFSVAGIDCGIPAVIKRQG